MWQDKRDLSSSLKNISGLQKNVKFNLPTHKFGDVKKTQMINEASVTLDSLSGCSLLTTDFRLGYVSKRQGEGTGRFSRLMLAFEGRPIRARLSKGCQLQVGKFLDILWCSLRRAGFGESRGLSWISCHGVHIPEQSWSRERRADMGVIRRRERGNTTGRGI